MIAPCFAPCDDDINRLRGAIVDPASPIALTRCALVVERARLVGLMLADGADPDRITRFCSVGAALTAIDVIAPAYAEEFGR